MKILALCLDANKMAYCEFDDGKPMTAEDIDFKDFDDKIQQIDDLLRKIQPSIVAVMNSTELDIISEIRESNHLIGYIHGLCVDHGAVFIEFSLADVKSLVRNPYEVVSNEPTILNNWFKYKVSELTELDLNDIDLILSKSILLGYAYHNRQFTQNRGVKKDAIKRNR